MEFSTMSEIDPAFIQAPEYRPKLKRIKKTSKEFFDLPLEEKKLAKRDEVNPLGYHDSEHTKNVRDWKELFDFLAKDPTFVPTSHESDDPQLRTIRNQWPAHPPEFRDVCEEYAGEVEKLAYKMLELISLSIGLPGDHLHSCFKYHISFLRVNHYPAYPFPELVLGAGRHKDASAFTVLAQDEVGGLEVRRKSDGAWISIKLVPGAFITNLGDATQVWSNDRYESAEHRVVVNFEKERFSIPFFFYPPHFVMLKPLEELVNEQNPARYREFNLGKFYVSKNRSDFKKREVEYVQIYHFRIF
ncbi:hypothetical protein EZV62_011559 [Acer yangbiense]|uniref:Fe2OG dioxygenase domain-containing protein n=1 Tax=Acer yangbiense TaxID=1000413 RepID=A0A5C7I635_9ROSI|nr:hypothetical protein EZV62_011559 [Acer yangbiense]